MAVCEKCGAEIEEGKRLCESCEDEEINQGQTEEYLDNLLDNIQAGSALEFLQKKGKLQEKVSIEDMEEEGSLEDFATLIGESSLEEVAKEEPADDAQTDDGLQLAGLDGLEDIDFEDMDDLEDIDLDAMEDLHDIELADAKETANEAAVPLAEPDTQKIPELEESGLEEAVLEDAPIAEALPEESIQEDLALEKSEIEEAAGEAGLPETDNMDDMLDQLLADLDNGEGVNTEETAEAAVSDEDLEKMMDDYMGSDEELQDLDELLAMMGGDEENAAADTSAEEMGAEPEGEDVLALDEGFTEEDLLALEGFDEEQITEEPFSLDESGIADAEDSALSDIMEEEVAIPTPTEVPEQKKGFFAKIFGNVINDDIAKKELEARKAQEEEEVKKAEERKEKEESDAIKKAEKKEKKEARAAEKKEEKERARQEKEAKKAEKRAKRQAELEEEEKEAALEVVGKLNKVGVGIVITLAIIFLAFVTLGTQSFSYSSAIADAKEYYENKKYTKAYEELLGIEIKEKDKEFYDKVITIMKVNRQIDSYSTFKSLKRFPEALDALLKGLEKYDSNYETALDLEIEDDMDACKTAILTSLSDEFDLTEEDAYDIVNSANQDTYNKKVVDVVVEQMKKVMEQAN